MNSPSGRAHRPELATRSRLRRVLVWAVLACSCRTPATEVLVRLDTDIPARRSIAIRVRANVDRRDAATADAATGSADAGETSTLLGIRGPRYERSLPIEFLVTPPPGGTRDEHVTLVIDATILREGPDEIDIPLRRTVRFQFTPSARTYVPVMLADACATRVGRCRANVTTCTQSVRCEESGLTCGDDGRCATPETATYSTADFPGATLCAAGQTDPANCGTCGTRCSVACEQGSCVRVVGITAGGDSTCGLLEGGGVRCWGANQFFQLGDITNADRRLPTPSVEFEPPVQIVTGKHYTCSRDASGVVACRGSLVAYPTDRGALFDRATVIGGIPAATDVSVDGFACVVANGGVYCWGSNPVGQLGDGSRDSSYTPRRVLALDDAVRVVNGEGFGCATRVDASVWCWGEIQITRSSRTACPSQSGDGCAHPRWLEAAGTVVDIAAGSGHACVIRGDDGVVACWGRNADAQLGSEASSEISMPTLVNGITGARSIAAGASNTCVVDGDGVVLCWGSNSFHQLGYGVEGGPRPVAIRGIPPVTRVDIGDRHICALTVDGAMYCWGDGNFGQLGDGTDEARGTPGRVLW